MHYFQKLVPDICDLETLSVRKDGIEKALNANECIRWIEPFIANLGHPLWGSQSMQELAPGMRNVLPFLIRNQVRSIDNTCINSHSITKHNIWVIWVILQVSIVFPPIYHNDHCWFILYGCTDTCASKIIPIKVYTHLLCTTKIWLSFTNVVKSYLRWKIATKVLLTPNIYIYEYIIYTFTFIYLFVHLNSDAVRRPLFFNITWLECVNSAYVVTGDNEAFFRGLNVSGDTPCFWAGDLSSCSHDSASSRCVTMDVMHTIARCHGCYAHLPSLRFYFHLKGKFLNPSAHDQTCFHVWFRNGF